MLCEGKSLFYTKNRRVVSERDTMFPVEFLIEKSLFFGLVILFKRYNAFTSGIGW